MGKHLETCKNCEQQFSDAFNFCPHCGQQAKDDLTVKVLFYNTISNYFSFDARFFKSFFPLLLKPGFIARKFVEGKRLQYLHPAQMYLFVAVVFFFLFSFIQREQVRAIDDSLAAAFEKEKNINLKFNKIQLDSIKSIELIQQAIKDSLNKVEVKKLLEDKQIFTGMSDAKIDSLVNTDDFGKNASRDFGFNTKTIDSLLALGTPKDIIYKAMGMEDDAGAIKKRMYRQALKFYESKRGGNIIQTFYDTIPLAMFFLLPIFALILKAFHFKKGRYAHHLVFSFYYFSFLFTVFSLILAINFIVDLPDWLDFLIMLSTFLYLVIALRCFYVQGWFKSFFKGVITSFVFLSVVTPIAFVLISIFAFLFY
ncbi:DUF3667 domain-containing protein [Hyunsoonleella flava]|uniref:DUF3667 domain-containing protein n=1 Tax=Hyunsoonleella flava TaxID=2527939 RepID=A0A4Q9FGT1_9FLAO|nr:DUF3667 domain-containing protein [Hyunsoonleella flava]TBN06489.1 DUF3667 domain-containing protein [Hyunsoonleella flava]